MEMGRGIIGGSRVGIRFYFVFEGFHGDRMWGWKRSRGEG